MAKFRPKLDMPGWVCDDFWDLWGNLSRLTTAGDIGGGKGGGGHVCQEKENSIYTQVWVT